MLVLYLFYPVVSIILHPGLNVTLIRTLQRRGCAHARRHRAYIGNTLHPCIDRLLSYTHNESSPKFCGGYWAGVDSSLLVGVEGLVSPRTPSQLSTSSPVDLL